MSRAIFETQEPKRSVRSLGLFSPFLGRDLILEGNRIDIWVLTERCEKEVKGKGEFSHGL